MIQRIDKADWLSQAAGNARLAITPEVKLSARAGTVPPGTSVQAPAPTLYWILKSRGPELEARCLEDNLIL